MSNKNNGNTDNLTNNDIVMTDQNNQQSRYYDQLLEAINLAWISHKGQYRKDGKTIFIFHPLAVMMKVRGLDAKIVAVLHDIIEDTMITKEDLIRKKFDEDIVEAVVLLSRTKDQKYFQYIKALSIDPLAREVKIADVQHNLKSLDKIPKEEERQFLRERYRKTLRILTSINKDNPYY